MSDLRLEVGGKIADGASNGNPWIGVDGLDGWWDSAETLFDETTLDTGDGAYDPTEVFLGPKRVQVVLLADASSPEWAELEVRTWAASLSKMTDLGFRVYSAGRWLSLRNAKVRGAVSVRPNRRDMRLTEIRFTAWSHDPRKYGQTVRIEIDATASSQGGLVFPIIDSAMNFNDLGDADFPGAFRIPNPGTADFYPVMTVTGPATSFKVTSEDSVIEYSATVLHGKKLVLSPYAGGRAVLEGADASYNLTRAEWISVQPGEDRGYLFEPVNPSANTKLLIEYPDGAWL